MKPLQTINAEVLMSVPMPVTKFIMEELLPEGLHILGGSPQVGKSWLALWLCLQVSKGEPVWELPTARGTVLYLCLEDSYSRIQSRLFQITDDAPDTLYFTNLSNSIGAIPVTAVTGMTGKMSERFPVTAVTPVTEAPVHPFEAACAAFSGWGEEVPATGEIGHVQHLWGKLSRSADLGKTVRGTKTGKRPPVRWGKHRVRLYAVPH